MNKSRFHGLLFPAIVFGVGTALCVLLGSMEEETPGPLKPPSPRLPIIRLDLIENDAETAASTVRDIFIPRPAVSDAGLSDPTGLRGLTPYDQGISAIEEASFRMPVHLTYVGFVASGDIHIALIVYQGQPMAVGEGDEIDPGIRVIRITSEILEVARPDSETKVFPIEGDRL